MTEVCIQVWSVHTTMNCAYDYECRLSVHHIRAASLVEGGALFSLWTMYFCMPILEPLLCGKSSDQRTLVLECGYLDINV